MKLFRPRDNLSCLKHGNVANFSWYASCKHIWRQAIEFEASCLCINGKESVQLTCWKKGKGIVEMEHDSTYQLEGYHLRCYLWNDALQWGGIENSGWYGNHELVIIQVYYLQVLKIINFLWYMSLVLRPNVSRFEILKREGGILPVKPLSSRSMCHSLDNVPSHVGKNPLKLLYCKLMRFLIYANDLVHQAMGH